MKQSFARQHSHRSRAPAVISLPPPRPPVAATPSVAIVPEPAALEQPAVETRSNTAPNRQARRKAMRDQAKALRRVGQAAAVSAASSPPIVTPGTAAPPPSVVAEPSGAASPAVPAAASATAYRPLPRGRSLAAAKPRALALLSHRLRQIFGLRQAGVVTNRKPQSTGAIAGQLRTLRDELAALQQSIDRMIDGVAA